MWLRLFMFWDSWTLVMTGSEGMKKALIMGLVLSLAPGVLLALTSAL